MSPKKGTRPLEIYVRVSDVRGRAGDGVHQPCRSGATLPGTRHARNYKTGEVFTDLDVSGGKMQRPGLDKAIERIRDGQSGGIIVAKLDRFARTLVGGLQTMEEINTLGGVVVIADGEFDTATATGELVLNMMLSLAAFELRRIKENWQSAKRHAVDRGIHISRFVPPGYDRDEARMLIPHPRHSVTVQDAFKMAAAGDSPARIARHLTERKLPIAGNGDSVWMANRIRRFLANRVYLGEARAGDGVANATAHAPLIDPVTFALAQRDRKGPVMTEPATALLAGLCRCSACSFSMRSQAPRAKTVGAYRCSTNSVHGRCPAPSTISAIPLEKYVIEQFLSRAATVTVQGVTEIDGDLVAAVVEREQSYRGALADTELRRQIGDADHGQLVASLHREWQEVARGGICDGTHSPGHRLTRPR